MKSTVTNDQRPVALARRGVCRWSLVPRRASRLCAFTLIEVMVVLVLLSLIVLALMAVFDSTQTAFRASVTQSGVLESGRAAMDLMADDLREMAPSYGLSNATVTPNGNVYIACPVNFYVAVTNYVSPPSPLIQPMIGGNSERTNVLEDIFILSRGNQDGVPTWYGIGYAVATNAPPGPLYSLYRFETNHPVASFDPGFIFTNEFRNFLTNVTSGSHLLDGVVDLTMRAYGLNGERMTANMMTNYISDPSGQSSMIITKNENAAYFVPQWGETGFAMFSNTLPDTVEIEMGVLEDRTLQRAESLGGNFQAQSAYLAQQAGKVHIFRQRVSIQDVDAAAYQ